MKIAIYDDYQLGLVSGDRLLPFTSLLPRALDLLPRQRLNWLVAHWDTHAADVEKHARGAEPVPLASVRLLPASPAPSAIFAAPANYRRHIGELGDRAVTNTRRTAREQGVFLKAPGSLVGAGQAILLPRGSARRFDHESELAVIIGRACRDVPRERAMEHVFGYSCLIDLTMRIEPGVAEEERSMRKSFETFTPLGPYLVTADEVPSPSGLSNRLWVNGELRQSADTADMIVDVAELVELASSLLALQPGDVIATGTPEGVGPVAPGDEVRIEIASVGSMTLPVREHAQVSPRAY